MTELQPHDATMPGTEHYVDDNVEAIELTRDEFDLIYKAIRLPTEQHTGEDVVDIVRTERMARLLLEQIRHRVGLRETPPAEGDFQTS